MADENLRFFASLLLGLGPALFLMWHALRRFDVPRASRALYDDRKAFTSLAAGMVFGVLASILSVTIQIGADAAFAGILLFLSILLEELFKLVYLNRKAYRGKFDTTFYGVTLGVGMSSTVVLASAYLANPATLLMPGTIAVLLVFSLSMAFVHAASGSIIGFGTAHGPTGSAVVKAIAVRAIHGYLLLTFILGLGGEVFQLVSLGLATAFAALAYAWVYREVLPDTLPRELRRELRRRAAESSAKE